MMGQIAVSAFPEYFQRTKALPRLQLLKWYLINHVHISNLHCHSTRMSSETIRKYQQEIGSHDS